jgi:hypothetical protein
VEVAAVESIDGREAADFGLLERFGTGTSALSPFDEVARARRQRTRAARPGARLGELLLSEGIVTAEELEAALAAQKRTRPKERLGELLLDRGLVSGPTLVRLLAQQCQHELEEESGFGTGLRRAIESEFRRQREQAA